MARKRYNTRHGKAQATMAEAPLSEDSSPGDCDSPSEGIADLSLSFARISESCPDLFENPEVIQGEQQPLRLGCSPVLTIGHTLLGTPSPATTLQVSTLSSPQLLLAYECLNLPEIDSAGELLDGQRFSDGPNAAQSGGPLQLRGFPSLTPEVASTSASTQCLKAMLDDYPNSLAFVENTVRDPEAAKGTPTPFPTPAVYPDKGYPSEDGFKLCLLVKALQAAGVTTALQAVGGLYKPQITFLCPKSKRVEVPPSCVPLVGFPWCSVH